MFKFNDDQKKEKETQDTYMNPLAFLIDTLTKEGFGVYSIFRDFHCNKIIKLGLHNTHHN